MNNHDPFDLSDAVIRDFKHVRVTRHAPREGRPCRYEKIFKAEGLGDAGYWIQRENSFLVDFALNKRLKYVVRLVNLGLGGEGNDSPIIESVVTRDAGITIEDWLRVQPRYPDGATGRHPFQHAGVFLQLLRACLVALREIHGHGIVHCDIKPDNICLPYDPYPFDRAGSARIKFEQIQLIDFAFSVTPERPLERPLPILPIAPYQSRMLRGALEADHSGRRRGGLAVQALDYRADLYSLGFLAERILETGLLQPSGSGGLAAYDGARRLVGKLKAVDSTGAASHGKALPHDEWIAEIDGLLRNLTDLEGYRQFEVARLRERQEPGRAESTADTLAVGPTPLATPEAWASDPAASGPLPQPPAPSRSGLPGWALALIILLPLLGGAVGFIWKDFGDYLASKGAGQPAREAARSPAGGEAGSRSRRPVAPVPRQEPQGRAAMEPAESPPSRADAEAQALKERELAEQLRAEREARLRAEDLARRQAEAAEQARQVAPVPPPPELAANEGGDGAGAKDAVLAYAAAVTRRDLSEALGYWKEPTAKLRRAIETTESLAVQSARVTYNGGRHAAVWIEMVGKPKGKASQRYEGAVDVELSDSGRWLILSTKGLKCTAGCEAAPRVQAAASESTYTGVDEGPAVKAAVMEYYAALNRRDAATARALRNSVSSKFEADVQAKEYARVNRLDEPVVLGSRARIWLDTTVKNFGGAPESWKGTVQLVRRGAGRWVIASMSAGLAKR